MKSRLLIALWGVVLTAAPACDARSGGAPNEAGTGGSAARPGGTGSGGTGGSLTGSGGTTATGGGDVPGIGGLGGGTPDSSGSGGADGATDTPPGAAAACAALAHALCAKAASCTPFATSLVFGSLATCEERLQIDCLTRFMPGTSATPADTTNCAESLEALPCARFARSDLGTACVPRAGSLPAGATCLDDRQCDTAFCARAPDAACGACAPPTASGSPCVRSACSAGTICPKGTSTCVAPDPGAVGAVCTVSEQCDVGNGLGCNPLTGRCIRLALASSAACGLDLATSTYTACAASGNCSPLLAGKCVAAAADGAACSTAEAGPPCLPPARCVNARCSLPDPSVCAP